MSRGRRVDDEVVLLVVVVVEGPGVDRRLLGVLEEESGEPLGLREIPGGVPTTCRGVLSVGAVDEASVGEPAGQLLGDGAGGPQQFFAGDHLSDHEGAEELAEGYRDLLGSEEVHERVLVTGVVGGVEPGLLGVVEMLLRQWVSGVTTSA